MGTFQRQRSLMVELSEYWVYPSRSSARSRYRLDLDLDLFVHVTKNVPTFP